MIINIIKISSSKTDFIFYDLTTKPIPHHFLDLRKKILSGRYICDSKNVICYDDAKITLINTFEVDNEMDFIYNKTMLFRKYITLNENLDTVIKQFIPNIGVIDKKLKEYKKKYYDNYYKQNKESIKQNHRSENYKQYQKQYHLIRYQRDKEILKEKQRLNYNNKKLKIN